LQFHVILLISSSETARKPGAPHEKLDFTAELRMMVLFFVWATTERAKLMYETKEMRAVMSGFLQDALEHDPNIVLLDADLARPHGTLSLFDRFHDRCFDVGVAESNMACISAGLASYGFKPFIFSFCAFITRRAFDPLMLSIAYAGQNVKIVGSDPGIAAELNGGTHMCFEDAGMARCIPGMVIFEPVDGDQLARALPQILAYEGPVYIRLFRKVPPATWFASDDYEFDLFKADVLREGGDVTLFTTGIVVTETMAAAELLQKQGISAEVINIHTLKPIDRKTAVASVRKTGCAVTCENHNIHGGLGSAVAEVLSEECPAPLGYIGAKDRFGEVGRLDYLLKRFEMDAWSIARKAVQVVERAR